MKIKLLYLLGLMLCFAGTTNAQRYATELIPLVDSTIYRFTNLFDFLPIANGQPSTKKYMNRILKAKTADEQQKYLDKLLAHPDSYTLCLLAFDYYFQHKQPVAGTNVEQFLNIIRGHDMYEKMNRVYGYQVAPGGNFKDSVWKKIGWNFGHGAFYYLSPEDANYLNRMHKINVLDIDEKVEEIIERYLQEQTSPFRYDIVSIVNEIKLIPDVKDVIHDGCLTKTMQLPNWDNIGLVIVRGKDTVERVYTIQFGYFKQFRLGKHISFPLKSNPDILFYKGVKYGLHFTSRTRKQCEENEQQHKKTMEEYEAWKKQQQTKE